MIFAFILLAAICNAVMDTITHHWDASIFKQLRNGMWWDPSISWKNKYVDRDPKLGFRKLFHISTHKLRFKPLIWILKQINKINYPV
jgi:hypothetical protein